MNALDQSPLIPLINDNRMVASVDYQVCDYCGFRLMRIETTIINNQHIVAKDCPICHQARGKLFFEKGASFLDAESSKNFDAWLAGHGIDRKTLDEHYHLNIEKFFDLN
jgi:hypothetical protein